ncbi:hypothetical protein TrVFT333_000209 [Trichoderma virens FT-333]|nr:hypothetical protein TrVFT333_000209 [Trichoderma virens FT-333]
MASKIPASAGPPSGNKANVDGGFNPQATSRIKWNVRGGVIARIPGKLVTPTSCRANQISRASKLHSHLVLSYIAGRAITGLVRWLLLFWGRRLVRSRTTLFVLGRSAFSYVHEA